ncbi:MAG: Cys-tRNA(Pro)/Cys-tRNA(Cys) deacylase [Thermoproteota archaeon]|nr:Cys-tRNA(Pro)/Cys-tRNA(Cys) deacylase [Thermoproteota archaeon]
MDLKRYLEENLVWHRFILKEETVHTVDAANATGIELYKITKNLVARTNEGEFVMLIVPGDRKVDLKKAASVLDVKNIQIVPFVEAEGISGYPPGGTPSIGHKTKMRVILDKTLLGYDAIFCGGGSRDRLLELRVADVIKLNSAFVADISI